MDGLNVKTAQELLPQLGEHLMRVPTLNKAPGIKRPSPQPCVVDFVHREHLWYRVRFTNGVREAYKVPEMGNTPKGAGWFR